MRDRLACFQFVFCLPSFFPLTSVRFGSVSNKQWTAVTCLVSSHPFVPSLPFSSLVLSLSCHCLPPASSQMDSLLTLLLLLLSPSCASCALPTCVCVSFRNISTFFFFVLFHFISSFFKKKEKKRKNEDEIVCGGASGGYFSPQFFPSCEVTR